MADSRGLVGRPEQGVQEMTQQLRLWLTLSAVEDEEINRAYAEYLLGSDEHKSRNQWLKDMIMENIRRK